MKITKEEIASYVPQRPPFIMVDNLISATKDKFVTDFEILPNNIFLEDGILREFALIENIGQSSYVGLVLTNFDSGSKPKDGFLGGISHLFLYDLPKVHDSIRTEITLLNRIDNMFLLKGENYLKDKKLLECEIKLVATV